MGIPSILGGDWNTILDGNVGEENLDLEDRYNIPQKDNGKMLREWIENTLWPKPCRIYPLEPVEE